MLRKFTRALLAVAALAAPTSSGKKDLNETPGLNPETIRSYMLDRAANVDKLPVLIEEISSIQKMALRGEKLSTCVVATRAEGPSGISLFYFVFSPDGRT